MWFFDALEKHLLMLYLYSILAGLGVALYMAWIERQGRLTIGAILGAFVMAFLMAMFGPHIVVTTMRELLENHAENPVVATLGCLVAVIALPLAYLIGFPSQANTVYFALTLAWIFAVAWRAAHAQVPDHSS